MNAKLAFVADTNVPLHVPNMPIEQYHADRTAVSNTGLKKVLQSPAHFLAYLNGEDKVTAAKLFGAAFHCFLLEPELFRETYVVEPDKEEGAVDTTEEARALLKQLELPVKGNKDELIARLKEHSPNVIIWSERLSSLTAGKKVLKKDDMLRIEAMTRNVRQDSRFQGFTQDGAAEQTFFWTDRDTGIRCKFRADYFSGVGLLDMKKTPDASAFAFAKSIANYGYDVQAAFYTDGAKACTGEDLPFVFVPVEDDAPHAHAMYMASEDMIQTGRRKYKQALETIAKCLETGEWPGYQPGGDIETIDLPRWAQ